VTITCITSDGAVGDASPVERADAGAARHHGAPLGRGGQPATPLHCTALHTALHGTDLVHPLGGAVIAAWGDPARRRDGTEISSGRRTVLKASILYMLSPWVTSAPWPGSGRMLARAMGCWPEGRRWVAMPEVCMMHWRLGVRWPGPRCPAGTSARGRSPARRWTALGGTAATWCSRCRRRGGAGMEGGKQGVCVGSQ
jgi:hypothetical protein